MRTYDLLEGECAPAVAPRGPAGSSLARFLELRGRRVFEAFGVLWGHYRGPFYCSLPYNLQIDPGPGEIEALLRMKGIRCLRFPSLNRSGWPGGLFVCRPQQYGLSKVLGRSRAQVRQGLERCEIRAVDPSELLVEGLALNRETMQRQGRYDPEFGEPDQWKRLVEAVRQCPGFEITGAYLNGRLSTYVVSLREDGWLHLLYRSSRTEELSSHTNHALDYWLIRNAANDPSIRAVNNSFTAVLRDDGLNHYKTHMGYEVVPLNLCFHVHPAIAPVLTNRFVVSAVQAAWKAKPENRRLELGAKVLEGARITMTNHFPILSSGSKTEEPCQHQDSPGYSRLWRPYPVFLLHRFCQYLRSEGLGATLEKTAGYIAGRTAFRGRNGKPAGRQPDTTGDVLGLQAGDWVEVKSEEEIRATLDASGKHRGLGFMPVEMRAHCGRRYRVFKRVEKILLEESRQNRKLKNTVILEGVHCQGAGLDCDRACFMFWREAWLKRVPNPGAGEER